MATHLEKSSGSKIRISDNKTFKVLKTLTLDGTDGATVNFGSGGTVSYGDGGGVGSAEDGEILINDGDEVAGLAVPTGGLVGITATQTLTNKTLTAPAINSPTGIVKGDVGLGNVDNTSDATKDAATATLTNKTLTSPTLTTPTLGVASATSVNKITITAPATGATLTIVDGKTLTVSNTLTFSGTDASSVAFGAGGTVVYESATQTLANKTLTTPVIGAATGTSLRLSASYDPANVAFGPSNGSGFSFGGSAAFYSVSNVSRFVIHENYIGMSSTLQFGWASGAIDAVALDTSLTRVAAGVIGVFDGSTGGAVLQFLEQTAPSAGAANTARVFAVDNGSGKTILKVQFASGAAQTIATEP